VWQGNCDHKDRNNICKYSKDGQTILTFLMNGIDWAGVFATGGAGVGPGFGNGVPAQNISIRKMLPEETSGNPGTIQ
jgi:hypothetical protein